ncbi:hypothetical protein CO172_01560 [Candidatus Uhrbacteria bacterium CG_4_9_14_3_um_filter_36_7]|uniref:ABC transporter ATP-binding protein n=1 Tax=Candidatus Uhrbacteria bacterium CG_4_9_14_3_um_filter_36_7 TaxID=1975033 RepID=A0A2M7XHT6_9BACT|nr:MAG: hypothetical protein CO172_01560 [Candidatus Uhrbacteria bacterium CG_4_9_14_3_um_filter_36_7]
MSQIKSQIHQKKLWGFFKPFIWPEKKTIFLVVFLFLITSMTQVFEPVVYGRIVDIIINSLNGGAIQNLFEQIGSWLLIWILLFVTTTLFSTIALYFVWRMGNNATDRFCLCAIKDVLGWSHERYADIATGKIMKYFDDALDGLFILVDDILNNVLPTVLTFCFVLGVGFWIDWRLTLISLGLSPLSIILGWFSWKKAGPRQHKINRAWGNVSRHLAESVANISLIQNFVQEKTREREYTDHISKATSGQLRLNIFWAIFYGVGGSSILLARVLVFVGGIYFVSTGSLTIGTLITFLGFLGFILNPIQHFLASTLPRLSRGMVNLERFRLLLSKPNLIQDPKAAKILNLREAKIELRHVWFTYKNQSKPTLQNIHLKIPGGTSCALVGPSGAGKSTLIKLLNRVLDPQKGSIFIDGQDLRTLSLASLRLHIGIVNQETLLFHDSILKNVRFVKPKAKRSEVIEACKKAQAHEFISKLPRGYESLVGERGVKLSGGERQRLALARIFLADPPILILDESTSALDSETEYRLQSTLQEIMKGRTTIIIAHRLSTIYLTDQIFVIKEGKIIDHGIHEELMKKGGLYDHLWKLQSGGYIK